MDAGLGTEDEVASAYRGLEQVNLRLGGYRATLGPLREILGQEAEGDLSILDVAGGDGRTAIWLVERLASPGARVKACVLDLGRQPTALAARSSPAGGKVVAICGDARRLPFPERSVDIVHSAAFLHHLSVDDARDVLGEMCRVSRRIVLVNDLVRSWIAAGSIWVLARLFSGNRLIRHDGPLSVLKAFDPAELVRIARAAGPSAAGFRWRLSRTFPYRMTLIGARVADPPSRVPPGSTSPS